MALGGAILGRWVFLVDFTVGGGRGGGPVSVTKSIRVSQLLSGENTPEAVVRIGENDSPGEVDGCGGGGVGGNSPECLIHFSA